MNIRLLNSVEETIATGVIPVGKVTLFAGAGLIVTNDPERNRFEDDVVVLSPYARKISWVVYQMKGVFADELDYVNKHSFYPALGRAANRAIEAGLTLRCILEAVVRESKNFWSNRPLLTT